MRVFDTAWWPHVRAALVALHLVAITVVALPAPGGGMSRQAWNDPTVKDEFHVWNGTFSHFGLHWTDDQLIDHTWDFAVRFMDIRSKVLLPFLPYYNRCGTWQGWRMFVAPHRYPAVLYIDVERNGQFEHVYVERSPEFTWNATMFDHDRFRSAIFRYSWPQFHKSYLDFVDWVATRARVDFPDATRVRLQFYKYRSLSPEEVRAGQLPDGKFELAEVRPLRDP